MVSRGADGDRRPTGARAAGRQGEDRRRQRSGGDEGGEEGRSAEEEEASPHEAAESGEEEDEDEPGEEEEERDGEGEPPYKITKGQKLLYKPGARIHEDLRQGQVYVVTNVRDHGQRIGVSLGNGGQVLWLNWRVAHAGITLFEQSDAARGAGGGGGGGGTSGGGGGGGGGGGSKAEKILVIAVEPRGAAANIPASELLSMPTIDTAKMRAHFGSAALSSSRQFVAAVRGDEMKASFYTDKPGYEFVPTQLCAVTEATSTATKKGAAPAGARKSYSFSTYSTRGSLVDNLDSKAAKHRYLGVLGTFEATESEAPAATPPNALFSVQVKFTDAVPQTQPTGHVGRPPPDEHVPPPPPLNGMRWSSKQDKADAEFQRLQGEALMLLVEYGHSASNTPCRACMRLPARVTRVPRAPVACACAVARSACRGLGACSTSASA
jgi:hypothetical protein